MKTTTYKNLKLFQQRGEIGRMMERVNSTMICCKSFCNVTVYPQYNNNKNKKRILNGVTFTSENESFII
jgi:hypothetical protein